jgi:hypothetical protein
MAESKTRELEEGKRVRGGVEGSKKEKRRGTTKFHNKNRAERETQQLTYSEIDGHLRSTIASRPHHQKLPCQGFSTKKFVCLSVCPSGTKFFDPDS